ncbi:chemotaxis protein methyltransferase CheR [Candidatus Kryptonium thompsonii]|uniref:protein-glutamate O-methyltransferase n=4 Tax=Candidatus Kryptonium thompsonii TaxID=1633631 RepID=A0A0P1MFJ6_9BACT|nr:protein-glutamate O-methyltransferase CheR [Candidatus Kryptonium thompsoni]CUS77285.1 chemotaxis protein methyltransferase CheR [Candidatus Kryptonium thompsoni]CUS78966.1 chemotaxis protein methyltransferase CheR [Candidatus Kryptonium thompsoni]CUS94216.1 chemotaxis protein methyltransferase CheR [Candidatus Kryptonium thompsoni]CUS94220.1 chemotaxis protein methyltransferase CheR [Candidatus Kryptonium thompsoni]CUS99231.1 chemotaxis protein methyltransferase CheR [Candidatus Kryptonium
MLIQRKNTDVLALTDEEFLELRNFIVRITGIYFPESKKYFIESKLRPRVETLGLKTYGDYLNYLRYSPFRGSELDVLFKLITINETYFFRDEAQFDTIEKEILPKIIESKPRNGFRTLRIWSAGCSTGDEAYTVAMIFLEKIKPKYPDVNVEIIGTDINSAVLDVARRGIYKRYSVRYVPENYMRKYFTILNDEEFHLIEDVKRLVKFKQLNLMDKFQMVTMRNFDLILLRNVLIYFDENSRREVVSWIYDSLNRGGYLIVGYSESLRNLTKAFKVVYFDKTIGYKKE